MVRVPRDQLLSDALASLPPEHRDQLRASEIRLIEYLNSRAEDAG
jgi:hypothetical protein